MAPELLVSPGRQNRWAYQYRNPQRDPVDIWVSLPRRHVGQSDIRLTLVEGAPDDVRVMRVNGSDDRAPVDELPEVLNDDQEAGVINVVARYRIEPACRVALRIEYSAAAVRMADSRTAPKLQSQGWRRAGGVTSLSQAERDYYLRSTAMVRVDHEAKAEALRLAASFHDAGESPTDVPVLNDVYSVFSHLTSDHYSYAWPPAAQGSESMRLRRSGDCGGYSFLLASWCRSIGIATRVIFGSWASGASQAHAWNEVFVEGIGWVPLDVSVAALLRKNASYFDGVIDQPRGFVTGEPFRSYFGGRDRGRLAFSVEAEAHPLPGYTEGLSPAGDGTLMLGHRRVHWGYQLLEGSVPYLQPAYPRFTQLAVPVDDRSSIGEWRFGRSRTRVALNLAAPLFLALGVASLALRLTIQGPMNDSVLARTGIGAIACFTAIRAVLGHAPYLNAALAVVLFGAFTLQVLKP